MYFKRQFYGGGAEWDARRKLFGVFFCDACGNEEWIEIKQPNLFRYDQTRQCPRCNSFGKNDMARALETKRVLLELEHRKIESEIEAVLREIETLAGESAKAATIAASASH